LNGPRDDERLTGGRGQRANVGTLGRGGLQRAGPGQHQRLELGHRGDVLVEARGGDLGPQRVVLLQAEEPGGERRHGALRVDDELFVEFDAVLDQLVLQRRQAGERLLRPAGLAGLHHRIEADDDLAAVHQELVDTVLEAVRHAESAQDDHRGQSIGQLAVGLRVERDELVHALRAAEHLIDPCRSGPLLFAGAEGADKHADLRLDSIVSLTSRLVISYSSDAGSTTIGIASFYP
jgi:hypothetical protein